MDEKLLCTYLRDHHAGSVTGTELARRAASNNEGEAYGPQLSQIADEIAADQQSLEELMDHLGCSRDRIKDTVAWTAEKAGRLKPNGRLFSYSPLSRVVEIEGLALGVTGKLALWRVLRPALGDRRGGVDLAELEARAADQQSLLESLRLRAAAEAFAAG